MAYKLKSRMRSVRRIPAWTHFPSELPPETLDRLVEFGEAAGLGKALVSDGDVDKTHRDGQVAWFNQNPSTKWIYELVDDLMAKANEVWDLDIDGLEPIQYTVYDTGHFYGWHWDQQLTTEARWRKMALSLQLSHFDAYAGGDLQVMGQDGLPVDLGDHARDRGRLIAFPAYLLHQVTPVTQGSRVSLVAWATGARPR